MKPVTDDYGNRLLSPVWGHEGLFLLVRVSLLLIFFDALQVTLQSSI